MNQKKANSLFARPVPGLTAGLCGGYSTLAAFAFENTMLLRAGQYLTSGSYILVTLLGSMVCFVAGYALANCLTRG